MHCETPSKLSFHMFLFHCPTSIYILQPPCIRRATIICTSFIRVAILDLSPTLSSHVRLGANHLISSSLVSKGLKILDIDYYVIIYEFIRFDFIWKRTTAFDPLWLPKVCDKFKIANLKFFVVGENKDESETFGRTHPFEDHCSQFINWFWKLKQILDHFLLCCQWKHRWKWKRTPLKIIATNSS